MSLEFQDLNIYRGQTTEWTITVVDADGAAFSLTGATLAMRIKESAEDDDPDVLALTSGSGITHATQSGATLGKATIVMTAAQTAALTENRYAYDVWLTKGSGEVVPVVPLSALLVRQGVNP